VVTGASSGLGAIFADQLAHRGLSLVLAGRDQARLSAVAQRVGQNVELLVGDLGTDAGVEALVAHLDGREIDVLVNNAGFGTCGPFAELDAAREHPRNPRRAQMIAAAANLGGLGLGGLIAGAIAQWVGGPPRFPLYFPVG